MQKVTLTAVYHNDKDRNGNPYMSKQGKPYTKCNIKATEYGDRYISGFGNKVTQGWKVGDTVEIDITPNGEYLNFSVPKRDSVDLAPVLEHVQAIRQAVYTQGFQIKTMLDLLQGNKTPTSKLPPYPENEYKGQPFEEEIKEEDVPF